MLADASLDRSMAYQAGSSAIAWVLDESCWERRQVPTCDEEAALAVEVEQGLPPLALPVLDHVGLIQDQVLPLLAPEHLCILHCA